MKVSIITVTKNNADTLQETIDSIKTQNYRNLEYVVYDRGSSDGTLDIIRDNLDVISKWDSKPDTDQFEALNRGIRRSSGGIIGTLRVGSLFYDESVVTGVAEKLQRTNFDACWGDVAYVDENDSDKVKRYWKSSSFEPGKFEVGWMPPHDSFFARRKLFEECGFYNPKFGSAADYELMLRFLKLCGARSRYISETLVKAKSGGLASNGMTYLGEFIQHQKDYYRSWSANGLDGGLLAPVLNPVYKLLQYFKKP